MADSKKSYVGPTDWLAMLVALLTLGMGALLSTFDAKIIATLGVALIVLAIIGLMIWFSVLHEWRVMNTFGPWLLIIGGPLVGAIWFYVSSTNSTPASTETPTATAPTPVRKLFADERAQLNDAFSKIHAIISGELIPATRVFRSDLELVEHGALLRPNDAFLEKMGNDWQSVTLRAHDILKIINDPKNGSLKSDIQNVVQFPKEIVDPTQQDLNYLMGSYHSSLTTAAKKLSPIDQDFINALQPQSQRMVTLLEQYLQWCASTLSKIETAQEQLRRQ